MTQAIFTGVLPAITTPFSEDLRIDHEFLAKHASWLIDRGSSGIVALGSLGEGATLSHEEKLDVLRTCVSAAGGRAPVVAAISALGTREAMRLAEEAAALGCRGLMVLPPYVHKGPWREQHAHFSAVFAATKLPAMLYNNPIAYGTDALPEAILELSAEHENLVAVKESSGDVRRITALRAIVPRLMLAVGVDDLLLEGVRAGATCWVAGLVNALPEESVRLMELALAGPPAEAFELYSWFLPLLRMDTVPEFVQLIKLVQKEVGMGSERVRPPRLVLTGKEREAALLVIRERLASLKRLRGSA